VPNLGIVHVDQGRSFVVADIPGLIAGAHTGKGLGVQFLRHIERTRVLVFLIEATAQEPKTDYRVLLNELRAFNADLLKKPRIVAMTKLDLLDKQSTRAVMALNFGKTRMIGISSIARTGINELVAEMWKALHSVDRTTGDTETSWAATQRNKGRRRAPIPPRAIAHDTRRVRK
jgi:GTP-binding protein